MRKLFPLLAAAFACIILLAACGDSSDDAADSADTPAVLPTATAVTGNTTPRAGGPAPLGVPAGMGSTAADGVYPRQVGHFMGTTTIPAEPKRIVVIATGQLDGVLTLGVVPIGAASALGASFLPDYLNAAFPQDRAQLAAMVDVGSRQEPDLEKLAGLKPDLILANKAGSEAIYDKLSAIAPTVFTEGTGVKWKQDFLLIAAAMGKTGAAQRFLDNYYAGANALGEKMAGKSSAVSMVRFNTGRTRMFGVSSFGGSIAYDAGLTRPASQQFNATSQDLSLEQVNLMDGDWIFYSVQEPADKSDVGAVVGNTLWNNLGAVKANHVVKVDDDPWYLNAGPAAAMLVLNGLTKALAPN